MAKSQLTCAVSRALHRPHFQYKWPWWQEPHLRRERFSAVERKDHFRSQGCLLGYTLASDILKATILFQALTKAFLTVSVPSSSIFDFCCPQALPFPYIKPQATQLYCGFNRSFPPLYLLPPTMSPFTKAASRVRTPGPQCSKRGKAQR